MEQWIKVDRPSILNTGLNLNKISQKLLDAFSHLRIQKYIQFIKHSNASLWLWSMDYCGYGGYNDYIEYNDLSFYSDCIA